MHESSCRPGGIGYIQLITGLSRLLLKPMVHSLHGEALELVKSVCPDKTGTFKLFREGNK